MKTLILKAPGTNRDYDVARAIELAGGEPEILPLTDLRASSERLRDYGVLIVPGGFSYGDALGAGKLFALDLSRFFADEVARFVETGRPVLGICNGFQVLVKAGILPGPRFADTERHFTLAHNACGSFECRWVNLETPTSNSIWTRGVERIHCPVAHGEGRFDADFEGAAELLSREGCVALRYCDETGSIAGGRYPFNPNGSIADIAGICNPEGNVLGLMPHPENAVFGYELGSMPGRDVEGARQLFRNGLQYAKT